MYSLYTFPKANLVPRWRLLVPTGESWCQVVPVGGSWCQLLVEPGEVGNVGDNPCSSVQDCSTM
jgi:hypothetical protein